MHWTLDWSFVKVYSAVWLREPIHSCCLPLTAEGPAHSLHCAQSHSPVSPCARLRQRPASLHLYTHRDHSHSWWTLERSPKLQHAGSSAFRDTPRQVQLLRRQEILQLSPTRRPRRRHTHPNKPTLSTGGAWISAQGLLPGGLVPAPPHSPHTCWLQHVAHCVGMRQFLVAGDTGPQ